MPPVVAGAIIAAVGATGITATLIGIGVSAAFSIGLSFAQQALFSKSKSQGQGPAPLNEGSKQTVRQAVPKRRQIYGMATTGGAIIFLDKDTSGNLFILYAFAEHEIEEVASVFVQGTNVFLDSSGNATTTPYFDGVTVFFEASVRLGASDQAIDPLLAANFPDLSSEFRQRGHFTLAARFFYGADRDEHESIWGQESNIHPLVRVKGKRIYDPRDPLQERDDPTTWKWSRNAALVLADYLRSESGGRLAANEIDLEDLKRAARLCDQGVSITGGSEPRYTIDAVVQSDEDPSGVIADMLGAMRGRIALVGGKVRILPGAAQDCVTTIGQDMLIGPFEYRGIAPRDELVNVVRGEFVSPERENLAANTPIIERPDLIASDGERLEVTLRHPYVEEHTRAQRLNKAFLEQARRGRTLGISVDMRALRLTPGDCIRVELRDFPFATGTYLVDRIDFSPTLEAAELALSEFDNEIYRWDPTVDQQAFELTEVAA